MDSHFDFPSWNLCDTALIVVCPADEFAFLQANPAAVHPSLTPRGTWNSGVNWPKEVLKQSSESEATTDIPGDHPAALLLLEPPRNGGAYIFGRDNQHLKPDVAIPNSKVSRRHFCVYPDLRHRTWIIQDLSGKEMEIDGCTVNCTNEANARRALRYDHFNRVVFARNSYYPGVVLYIKPVWPEDSRYLTWDWQDPNLPELADLNLSWTLTSAVPSYSHILPPQEAASTPRFCVLDRRLCDNIELFYGQDLETGAMVNEHLLLPTSLCLLHHPYIVASCPFNAYPLADWVQTEPLDDWTTYALLRGILSALHILFMGGVAGVTISSDNVIVADLTPGEPHFWLTGVSYARPVPADRIKEKHSAEVKAAVRMVVDNHGNSKCFWNPCANTILAEFFPAQQDQLLSANDILDRFAQLTDGAADYSFKTERLLAEFPLRRLQLNGQVYYHRSELARMASALFSQAAEESEQIYTKILSTKPSKTFPGHEVEYLLEWEEVKTLFERFGKTFGINFWLTGKKGRDRRQEDESVVYFSAQVHISFHSRSGLWNLSQLINSIRPACPLEVWDADVCVEVCGDASCEGLYVDLSTFRRACCLLNVSPPAEPIESPGDEDEGDRFRAISGQSNNFGIADKKLLGTAIFNRSSRTLMYGGTEYSENKALELFPQDPFKGLHRAITQSMRQPQSLKTLCQAHLEPDISESQCVSLTESLPDDPYSFANFKKTRRKLLLQAKPDNLTEEWVETQFKRRRRSRADAVPENIVNGFPQQMHQEPARAVPYYSSSQASVLTTSTTRYSTSAVTSEVSWF
ncbi:hypothetical protein AJ80_05438 [Polytolypa hystricis UAMH7299]|uniref:FHA domain-containing protein n=1 Tax=Polytolypa hystricis (strain UAMH7299) TaxID=1447883 RepID=A0A2B7Y3A8_POLH7|nr:hypothetical protein AJ80_05438 [Polytolypa hystricis UAMH7299]